MEAFAAPGQESEEPILRGGEETVNPAVQARAADIGQRGQPDDRNDSNLNGQDYGVSAKDEAGERGQALPLEHAGEDFFELGQDVGIEEEGHGDDGRRDGEGDENEVVVGAADIGYAVTEEEAAGRDDLVDVTDASADAEYGADLRGKEAGHLFEGFAEAQALFDVRGQEMEADAQGAVAAGGGLGNSGFRGVAFVDAQLKQIQEQAGALVAAEGEREKEVDEVTGAADGQEPGKDVGEEGQDAQDDGLERVGL